MAPEAMGDLPGGTIIPPDIQATAIGDLRTEPNSFFADRCGPNVAVISLKDRR
jgi:hypothetical protein